MFASLIFIAPPLRWFNAVALDSILQLSKEDGSINVLFPEEIDIGTRAEAEDMP